MPPYYVLALPLWSLYLGCAAQQRLSIPTDTPAVTGLAMPLYDGSAYYNAVKNRWFGLGDYATDQPGR